MPPVFAFLYCSIHKVDIWIQVVPSFYTPWGNLKGTGFSLADISTHIYYVYIELIV